MGSGHGLKAAADRVLRKGVESGGVPGVAAAVTTRDGTLYSAGFGRRDLRRPEPMDADTVCSIASITKSMASFGVMQQVERGKLSLDEPLARLVPYLGEVRVLTGFDDAGQSTFRQPAGPITLRQLLSHTAGFSYDAWNPLIRRYRQHVGAVAGKLSSLRMPLLFDPGARWEYGISMDWAGQALEAVTGQRLEPYLQENLFGPLGMDASWAWTDTLRPRLAGLHHRQPDGSLTAVDRQPPDYEFESGGGGIYTSANDYLKFIRMFLSRGVTPEGVRLMKEETIALMSRADTAPNNAMVELTSANPAASNDGEFFPGLPKRHGLGFMVNEAAAPTGRSAGSLAWAGIANTYFWIDPARGIGGVYMTQIMPFMDAKSLPLFLEFETAVYENI